MNISAINTELAKIGYKAVKVPKAKGIAGWKPQTPEGRRCKSRMAMFASLPPVKGVSDYQVRGADGQWYSDWMDGFAEAKAYQKSLPRPTTGYMGEY
jgi:hypothetical protein